MTRVLQGEEGLDGEDGVVGGFWRDWWVLCRKERRGGRKGGWSGKAVNKKFDERKSLKKKVRRCEQREVVCDEETAQKGGNEIVE